MNRSRVGFIAGLSIEARLLGDCGLTVGIGGGTPAGAARAAETIAAAGCSALISFGLAGGLNPDLLPGAIMIPANIREGGDIFPCDTELLTWLGGATADVMLAGSGIAVTAAQKSALFRSTDAAAIDLESGAVARVAAAHGLPFAVLRAVADPARRTLPPAALIALNAAGKISLLPIIAALFANPLQIPALLALARDAGLARGALIKKLRSLT